MYLVSLRLYLAQELLKKIPSVWLKTHAKPVITKQNCHLTHDDAS